MPVDTFNKIWITPADVSVVEKGNTALVLNSHLTVMTEKDYLATDNNVAARENGSVGKKPDAVSLSADIVKSVLLPAIEKEVNEGKTFANLRQIYGAMILATWFKQTLKESLLGKAYANQSKVNGVNQDPKNNQMIYEQYVAAFKKGVVNMIKEDTDKYTQEVIPRKFFSGGMTPAQKVIIEAPTLKNLDQTGLSEAMMEGQIDRTSAAMAVPGTSEFSVAVEEEFSRIHNGGVAANTSPEQERAIKATIADRLERQAREDEARELASPGTLFSEAFNPAQGVTANERYSGLVDRAMRSIPVNLSMATLVALFASSGLISKYMSPKEVNLLKNVELTDADWENNNQEITERALLDAMLRTVGNNVQKFMDAFEQAQRDNNLEEILNVLDRASHDKWLIDERKKDYFVEYTQDLDNFLQQMIEKQVITGDLARDFFDVNKKPKIKPGAFHWEAITDAKEREILQGKLAGFVKNKNGENKEFIINTVSGELKVLLELTLWKDQQTSRAAFLHSLQAGSTRAIIFSLADTELLKKMAQGTEEEKAAVLVEIMRRINVSWRITNYYQGNEAPLQAGSFALDAEGGIGVDEIFKDGRALKSNLKELFDALNEGRVNLDHVPEMRDNLVAAYNGVKDLLDRLIPDSKDDAVVLQGKAALAAEVKKNAGGAFTMAGVKLIEENASAAQAAEPMSFNEAKDKIRGILNNAGDDALMKEFRQKYLAVREGDTAGFVALLQEYLLPEFGKEGLGKFGYHQGYETVTNSGAYMPAVYYLEGVLRDLTNPAQKQDLVQGGIDFNEQYMKMNIKRDGNGVMLPVSQQNLESIQINGLVPVILNIQPLRSLPMLSEAESEPTPAA